ncbi:Na(+)/H(+) antiporter NhaC [Vibrio stylophorae]|uniref:Na(+)/H(+) antiporter NhaC n=1 Tax=Vibrio stylophorae TaxID=659351 RepID=A0ABM8ZUK9_9VIBR|nr:Na+/H+ antiporter NhaC family protein [Vibrio stylophorae]CAH0534011.1 Na(+)/H(+) antiporter NhaC [Vibrio stylophorae]
MTTATQDAEIKASFLALTPLALFIALFVGVGAYLTHQGVDYAFYQLPAPVAILPAIILAIVLGAVRYRHSLSQSIESFLSGMGHSDIIAMCLIYLLAGAFATVADATGGVDATVGLGLSLLSAQWMLPGIFIISAFVATAMGTSMGTIGAIAPIAYGIAQSAGIDPVLMAGVVLSGAMFGDNLSIISDTTIAATRSQGCNMSDKFKANLWIALPAAIIVLVLFFSLNQVTEVPAVPESIEWIKVLPYLTILVLAVAGMNVFVVLTIGILMAGGLGLVTMPDYQLTHYVQDIYKGFTNMQQIFLLSLLVGGLGELMRKQGGLAALHQWINRVIERVSRGQGKNRPACELGIATLVSASNVCVANNTVAIIVSGQVAKSLAMSHDVSAKRAASLLDIFSCVVQGLIPYGAQALLVGASFKLSPVDVITHSYYAMVLAVCAIVAVFIRHAARSAAQSA